MLTIDGTYLDGRSAEPLPSTLEFDGSALKLRVHGEERNLAVECLKISDRLGSTPRHISWGQREKFVTTHNDLVDELAESLGLGGHARWIAKLESKNTIALVAAVTTIGFALLFAVFGVPAIARSVALQAPVAVSTQLAESTMVTIDQILAPSEIDEARRVELTQYFTGYAPIKQLEFRKAEHLGPNALTLSATTVVFTDELIHLADNDQQLLAVYFHELGHAELRHVEQSILQNSAWVVLFSVIVGDFSGAGELLVSLPLVVGQMAYSRELEREADQYAIDALLEVGLDPDALADILEKLDRAHTLTNADADSATEAPPAAGAEKSDSVSETAADANRTEAGDAQAKDWAERVFEYLSTHPATDERLAHIRSFSTAATRDATR